MGFPSSAMSVILFGVMTKSTGASLTPASVSTETVISPVSGVCVKVYVPSGVFNSFTVCRSIIAALSEISIPSFAIFSTRGANQSGVPVGAFSKTFFVAGSTNLKNLPRTGNEASPPTNFKKLRRSIPPSLKSTRPPNAAFGNPTMSISLTSCIFLVFATSASLSALA